MTPVTLTDYELEAGRFVAGKRATGGYSDLYAAGTVALDVKIERGVFGVYCEIAAARGYGLYWPPSWGTYHDPDLPPDWQVRGRIPTSAFPNPDLCFRPGDNPDHKYILVTGSPTDTEYSVYGWIFGRDCVRDKWAGHSGGSRVYYAPRRYLNPIERNF